jgi:hypothetical protein
VVPANGAVGVGTNASAVVRFSEAMRASSLGIATVQVLAPGDLAVSGTVAVSGDLLSVTFDPTDDLAPFTHYRVRVAGGAASETARDRARRSSPSAATTSACSTAA